ncbi:MAG: hypothetical protein CM1200mP41_37070 [Gammaproteobacteria bacterium]|nr:MAG: hypothetical protein CM1200mP41_37070 [Gammaproteobacteria bacterium]
MLIEQTSIVMITKPIYFPIVSAFGWDPVWFGAIMLLNLEMATISPPFGLSLFVMKGLHQKIQQWVTSIVRPSFRGPPTFWSWQS